MLSHAIFLVWYTRILFVCVLSQSVFVFVCVYFKCNLMFLCFAHLLDYGCSISLSGCVLFVKLLMSVPKLPIT